MALAWVRRMLGIGAWPTPTTPTTQAAATPRSPEGAKAEPPTPSALRPDGVIDTDHGVVPVLFLPGTRRGFFLEVVGESHYQNALGDLWEGSRPEREVSVRLVAEPDNQYDPNAVAVTTFRGVRLGHLPREEAARYQQLVLQIHAYGIAACCQAKIVGGTSRKPSLGLWLDVERPTIVASRLSLTYKRVVSEPAEV